MSFMKGQIVYYHGPEDATIKPNTEYEIMQFMDGTTEQTKDCSVVIYAAVPPLGRIRKDQEFQVVSFINNKYCRTEYLSVSPLSSAVTSDDLPKLSSPETPTPKPSEWVRRINLCLPKTGRK